MVRSFLALCKEIGCPVALDKTEWANTIIVFLGVLLDGVNHCISVPDDKKCKALSLIHQAVDSKKVTIKFIQKLAGTLNFLNKAIVPGRAFTRSMYDKLKIRDAQGNALKQYHHVNLGAEFINDCRVWEIFLETAGAS